MKTFCIYHADCIDGASSAAVVRRKFSDAELHPRNHGEPPPENLKGSRVFIVDFSFSEEVLRRIASEVQEFHWFDHHKTAVPIQEKIGFGVIDLQESGATLTWKQLFPGLEVPKILRYVRDKDLWLWKLADSREVSADIRETDGIFNPSSPAWQRLLDEPSPKEWKLMVERGKHSRRLLTARLEKAAKRGFAARLNGVRAFAVNWTEDSSELGEYIYKKLKYPVALIFSYNGKDWGFSLRSNTVDVSEIALGFGGGGHAGAAGFRTPTIEWLFEKRET